MLFYYYHDFNIIIIIVNIFMKSFILRRCLGIEFGLWLPFRRIFGLGLAEVRRLGRKSGLKSDEIYPILAPTLFVTTPRAIYDSRGFSGLFLRFPSTGGPAVLVRLCVPALGGQAILWRRLPRPRSLTRGVFFLFCSNALL